MGSSYLLLMLKDEHQGTVFWQSPYYAWRSALAIVLPYFILSLTWIVFSDRLLGLWVDDSERLLRISTYKGWFFVAATSLLFGLILFARARYRQRQWIALSGMAALLQRLANVTEQAEVLSMACTSLRSLVGADGVAILLRSGDQLGFVHADSIQPILKSPSIVCRGNPFEALLDERSELVFKDVSSCSHASAHALFQTAWVRGLLVVTLGGGEQAPGVLLVAWAKPWKAGTQQFNLVRSVADAVGICIDRIRAYNELETRVKERTQALKAAMVQAQMADNLKSAFLATMSHELRTPLNSIIGFTGVLLKELPGPLTDEQRKQLGMVRESGRHLLALINDVLDISKIEAGQMQVEHRPFAYRPVIQNLVDTLAPSAAHKGLQLLLDADPAAPVKAILRADKRRFEQVLFNLIGNAIKFTDIGEVRVVVRHGTDAIRIAVQDTDPGIAASQQTAIFEPFRQGDGSINRVQEGTGLGLAISSKLAGLMGGKVDVASCLGKGSTFTLTIPFEDEDTVG